MEIQGAPEDIERVIQAIQAGRWVEIEGMDSRQIPIQDEREFITEH